VKKVLVLLLVVFVLAAAGVYAGYRKATQEFCWNRTVDILFLRYPSRFHVSLLEILPIKPWHLKNRQLPNDPALYYLSEYVRAGGSTKRPCYFLLLGRAYVNAEDSQHAISSFLKASQRELDSSDYMRGDDLFIFDYSPRQMLILEMLKTHDLKNASLQCDIGEQQTPDPKVRKRYAELRNLIEQRKNAA
jgi:hypothetical protein